MLYFGLLLLEVPGLIVFWVLTISPTGFCRELLHLSHVLSTPTPIPYLPLFLLDCFCFSQDFPPLAFHPSIVVTSFSAAVLQFVPSLAGERLDFCTTP